MNKYNLPASSIMRHYDVSGRICPISYSINNWERWNKLIKTLSINKEKTIHKKRSGKIDINARKY